MKKGLTELVFVLDRSGSMSGLESDTIGGFNRMIEKQKTEPGEVMVTTVLFDHQYEVIHDRFPIHMIRPLTEKDYYARGCTALLDAVGMTIDKVSRIQRYLPREAQAEKVIFVITTDGYENSSKEYTYKQIREMIRQKEQAHWEFIFLGANMDAVSEAEKIGIAHDRAAAFENDSDGVQLNYEVITETISAMRACAPTSRIDGTWKKKIDDDYKKRRRNHMK
ncbi:MAG TPA: VWA domain-containing protein [Candidatus Scybalocola faecipullorum]|nr:VWA domain-containing protein [Candidatus Scybalocola faecipullorum]